MKSGMLLSFKSHEKYFEYVFAAIFKIVITMPQFNNERDIKELCEIYFRKIAMCDFDLSSKVCMDCYELVEFLTNEDELSHIISTFDDYRQAYHYMALMTHLYRIENKYELVSNAPDMHYNICSLLSYNQVRGY